LRLSLALLALGALLQETRPAATSPPRLVVVCVVDQMREEYLDRFARGFGEGGFKRLLAQGTRYAACDYPYAGTETGPGHATIATGTLPSTHGIVSNRWFDRAVGKSVYCVSDSGASLLGPKGRVKGAGMSPRNLLVDTLGDRLRKASDASRVFAISQKDRAAIPLGGRLATGVLWFHPPSGQFVTSTFFGSSAPAWLAAFTQAHSLPAPPRVWERLHPDSLYELCGPDETTWERCKEGLSSAFPHSIASWKAANYSPVALEMLTDLALEILDREKLGQQEAPDLLLLSYSATDYVGHAFGPDSHEVFDIFARLDRELARLLARLDATVGAGRYVFALTSDHGVCDVPEVAAARGKKDVGRLDLPSADIKTIETALGEALGKSLSKDQRWIAFVSDSDVYLDAIALRSTGIERQRAAEALRDVLSKEPWVAAAFTLADIRVGDDNPGDEMRTLIRASIDPSRSGDVYFVPRPGWIVTGDTTTHGTPHAYDRRVPLLLMGGGAVTGRVIRVPVTPADLAPTLGEWSGVERQGFEGRILPR
jgi:arylsulfatase A-like enzyme